MKIEKKKLFFLIGITIVFGVLLLSLWLFSNGTNREINRFYDVFSLKLPEKTSVLFHKDTFGAMGDGASLVIYQISPQDMGKFTNQAMIINSWVKLPIPQKLSTELRGKIATDGELSRSINLGAQAGYYFIIDRFMSYNPGLKAGYDPDSDRFSNFTLGMIDVNSNRIYFYEYNQ